MSYTIIADSCADRMPGLEFITRIPMNIDVNGISYIDDETMNTAELIEQMALCPEAPRSACPSPGQFAEAYENAEGDVYVVTLSREVSGTYAAALAGAELVEGRNIHVFNSRSAAAGETAVCLEIKRLADSGLPFEEVVKQGEKFCESLTTLFCLETLDVFRKNGRLTHLQAVVTGALKIKLVMGADKDGRICMCDKALSMERALIKLAERVGDKCREAPELLKRTLVITQCAASERAAKLRDKILSLAPFASSIICPAGGLSTMYANAGGIIVSF